MSCADPTSTCHEADTPLPETASSTNDQQDAMTSAPENSDNATDEDAYVSGLPAETTGSSVTSTTKQVVTLPAPTMTTRRPSPIGSSSPSSQAGAAARAAAASTKTNKKKKSSALAAAASAAAAAAALSDKGAQGENTGRWTAEEHRLFLQGLEQHGKGWKKIASLIKSRTVVQIRTHAQKYFQKLAKARQNGEEGDVTMEGRGGVSSVASVSTEVAAQTNKRRRPTTGTKRKAIQSVVVSAQRQFKKIALEESENEVSDSPSGIPSRRPFVPAPLVLAPALAHFVLPNPGGRGSPGKVAPKEHAGGSSSPSPNGLISGPALEDSIFRFLSPAPVLGGPPLNEIARQAGANPITLPTENPSSAPSIAGEVSPTSVHELSIYPSWTDSKEPPSWYAKGADVDALLDVSDSLDWLEDTGDLHESYQPPALDSGPSFVKSKLSLSKDDTDLNVQYQHDNHHGGDLGQPGAINNASVSTLPHVDSNVESVVPPLPSLFEDGTTTADSSEHPYRHNKLDNGNPTETHNLSENVRSASPNLEDHHLEVFENPMEEHDFMSTILAEEENMESNSSSSLPILS